MALKWILANDANDKIDKGQITINQNTTFTGDATFLSKGTDESITINSGSIVFKRNDIPLTTIKNIRFGSITTDYNGKGRVSFQGFKKPILILPSIRSFTSDSNIASLYCYAEEVDANTNTYKFVIKATSEYHTPPTDIKVMGKIANFENSIAFTWKDFGFNYAGKNLGRKRYPIHNRGNDTDNFIVKVAPSFRIKAISHTINTHNQAVDTKVVYNNIETIIPKCIKHGHGDRYSNPNWTPSTDEILQYEIYSDRGNINKILNSLVSNIPRSNVTLEIIIEIIEHRLVHKGFYSYWVIQRSEGDGNTSSQTKYARVPESTIDNFLTINDFINFFITYNSETSEISNPWGEGEVQYIAMEIDDK